MPKSHDLNDRQNSKKALDLLYIQRKLYSKAKVWGYLRLIGVLLLGLLTPVITFYSPRSAVLVAALSGIWIILSKSVFKNKEKDNSTKAAIIQNEFDTYVFGIDSQISPGVAPTLEEKVDLLPPISIYDQEIEKEKLRDWYPFRNRAPKYINIAIAQRSNVVYTYRLLRVNSSCLLVVVIVWLFLSLLIGILRDLSAYEIILGVLAPIAPGVYDNLENWREVRQASQLRESLACEIEDTIKDSETDLVALVESWQSRIYELRITTPTIPNIFYWLLRDKNEKAMETVADILIDEASDD